MRDLDNSFIGFKENGWQTVVKIERWALGFILSTLLLLFVFIGYGQLPNRWYQVMLVYSGSMSPTFDAGDLVIITPPPALLKPGMVLTFQVNGEMVTHRLIGFSADGKYITKGDANNTQDDWSDMKVGVHGMYRGHIPYLGYLLSFPRSIFHAQQTGS